MSYEFMFPRSGHDQMGTTDPEPAGYKNHGVGVVKPTKAISGYAEWFYAMARNWKPVENRPWSLFRHFKMSELPVRVYLHASKTLAPSDDIAFIKSLLTSDQRREFEMVDWKLYRGHIMAEITIIGEAKIDEDKVVKAGNPTLAAAAHSPWAFGPFVFVVKDGKMYDKPIPYRGQLGFFEVNIGGKA